MNITTLLSSLNKIGMIAFLITLGFLIFEIIQFRKASQARSRPKVPQFQGGAELTPEKQQFVEKDAAEEAARIVERNKSILLVLVILLIFFGLITIVGYVSLKSRESKTQFPAPSKAISQVAPPKVKAKDTEASPTTVPSPTLTSTPTPEASQEPEVFDQTPTPTPEEIIVSSPTPTTIMELPETGYINNMLVIFSLASLAIFFSFLF